jgi:hypothetical protein
MGMPVRAQILPLVLVVRYGFSTEFDAVGELDKIIEKKDQAWFGKFGQRIGKDTINKLESQTGPRLIVLLKNLQKADTGKHKAKTYNLLKFSQDPPSDKSLFPPYYKSHMDKFGTWIGLQRYDGPEIDLARLYVRSSARPVVEASYVSMRGSFVCRLRPIT